MRRIAEAYGVSYDAFLLIAKLSAGTGISIERLQDMTSARIMGRLVSRARELLETPEGQTILDNLNAMGSRNRRRVSAVGGF